MSSGKTTSYASNLLKLIFNATTYNSNASNGIAINGTAGTPVANLYVSLHTGTLSASSTQSTSEAAYMGYARVAVARTSSGWTVTSNSVSPAATIVFGACTGGTETETYFGIGTDSTGTGTLLYWGAISPTIAVSSGVTPELTTATAITEA